MREDGCIQYTVTRHIQSPFAEGQSFPIAFNEIWRTTKRLKRIANVVRFSCSSKSSVLKRLAWLRTSTLLSIDEPENYDAPVLKPWLLSLDYKFG